MALRHRHTFLDMQYECDTSKAARGTGADLSIHRLEPTVTQRPYTAVRNSRVVAICFSTSGVPLNCQCLCKPRVQVVERDLVRSSISRLHTYTEDAWCSAMVYAIGCQFNSPDAHQIDQNDSSSRSQSPWPVQGPTVL